MESSSKQHHQFRHQGFKFTATPSSQRRDDAARKSSSASISGPASVAPTNNVAAAPTAAGTLDDDDDLWLDEIDEQMLIEASQMVEAEAKACRLSNPGGSSLCGKVANNNQPGQGNGGEAMDIDDAAALSLLLLDAEMDEDGAFGAQSSSSTSTSAGQAGSKASESPTNRAHLKKASEGPRSARNPLQSDTFHHKRFDQTQTVFNGPTAPKGGHAEEKRLPATGAAIRSEEAFSKPAPPPPAAKHPFKPLVTADGSGKVQGQSHKEIEFNKLQAELEELRAEKKKLAMDQYSRIGEISFLKAELAKRKNELESEKNERQKMLEVKEVELKQAEAKAKSALESIRTERDFLLRDIEVKNEALRRSERRFATQQRPAEVGGAGDDEFAPPSSQVIGGSQARVHSPLVKKHRPETGSPPFRKPLKRPRVDPGTIPKSIDASLLEDYYPPAVTTTFVPPPRAAATTTEIAVQTNDDLKRSSRSLALGATTNYSSLAATGVAAVLGLGEMAGNGPLAATLGGGQEGSNLRYFQSSTVRETQCLEQLFASLDRSLSSGQAALRPGRKSDQDCEPRSQIRRDLKAIALTLSQPSSSSSSSRSFWARGRKDCHFQAHIPQISSRSIDTLAALLSSDVFIPETFVAAKALLSSPASSSGGDKAFPLVVVAALKKGIEAKMSEMMTQRSGGGSHGPPHDKAGLSRRVEAKEALINYLASALDLLKVNPGKVSALLCRNSKDSCFIYAVWSSVGCLVSDVSADQTFFSSSSSSLAPASHPARDSESSRQLSGIVQLTAVFANWVAVNFGLAEHLAWIGEHVPCKSCSWCRSDLLKSLTSLTWAVVAEVTQYESLGRMPPTGTFAVARSCVLCLHHVWSSDPSGFVNALGESPSVQRRYIWTSRHLMRLKPALNLNRQEALILSDLSVECDHGASAD